METRKSITQKEIYLILLSIVVAVCVVPIVYSLSFCVQTYFKFLSQNILSLFWVVFSFLAGGVLVGILVYKAPECEGPGLHIVIAAFNKLDGRLRLRTGIIKYAATLFTIGSGTSNGLISPSAMLGNSVASYIGSAVPLTTDQHKTLSLCGMSAAISALLGTPFGAALFAVEVVYGNYILYKRFFYCLISSVCGYACTYFLGLKPVASVNDIPLSGITLLYIVVTAFAVVVLNIGYIFWYQKIHDIFINVSWGTKTWVKPVIGMGAAGVIVAPVYALLTRVNLVGGEQYSLHILYTLPVIQLIIIFCVMFVTTALVAGTGNSGGLFMPVMVMGAIVGIFAASVMGVPPVLLVIVGISAALCTTLNVPLASAVICIELWGPTAIIPSIVGSLVGYFVGKDYIIYHEIQWEELKE